MKVDVLYLGRLDCFKYHLIRCGDEKEYIKSPISAVLIRHPELGNILYDTGNSPFYSTEYPKHILETYPVAEFISIEEALHQKGMAPADIDMLILSHLHFDHAGGLRYFRGTRAIKNVIVSKAELENVYYQVMTGSESAYIKKLFDIEEIKFHPIENNVWLSKDLELFIQKAHTPGLIGMHLKDLSKGNMIFTGDTVYTKEAYEKELPPGGKINKTEKEFFDNLKIIKKMQKENQASLVFGHDFAQIERLSQHTIE